MKRLTQEEAIRLLPYVVDNEASETETIAFLAYIETDDDLHQEYHNALQIKRLLRKKYVRRSAPKHLRERIIKMVQSGEMEDDQDRDIADSPGKSPSELYPADRHQGFSAVPILRYLSAAAVILFITLITIELLDRTTIKELRSFELVEHYTALHFADAGSEPVEPHFATSSVSDAEAYLLVHHGLDITVPEISGTEFAGLVISDFYNGLDTPLLAYSQPDLGETIFVFTFQLDKLNHHKEIKRDSEAVKNCVKRTDFHVSEVDGYHVVSWLWDDIWYSAVSNHNGYDLASLVEPLNYSP